MIASPAGRLAVQIWVAAFIGLFGTYLLNTVDGLRVPVQLIYGIPLAGWALLRLRGPRDVLDVAVLIAVLAHLAVAILSADPTGSLEATGLALGLAGLFWLMRQLRVDLRGAISPAVVAPAMLWLVAVGVAWVLEKVAWVGAGGGVPALESYQVFVWGTTNAFPVLVLLTVPFVGFMAPGRWRLSLAAVLGATAVIVVPLSVGRAGWVGIAVAALAHEALAGWPRPRAAWRLARQRPAARVAVAVAGAAALVALALNAERVAAAIGSNIDTRQRIWQQATGVFGADPLTGSGPGTFSWMRLPHVPDFTDPIGVILAHNALLQTLADGGLLLGFAFGAVVALWLMRAWRKRAVMTTAQRLAAAAVIGLGAASLLDDFSFLPALMAMSVTLAAWSVPAGSVDDATADGRPWLLVGAALVAAIVLLPSIAVERARMSAATARADAVAGRWQAAADQFAQAVASHPTHPLLRMGYGLALAELGRTDDARVAYQEARAVSPADPRAAGALAALTDDPAVASGLLEEATRISTDAQYGVRLTASRHAAGDVAGAARAYALAVVLRTDLYRLAPEFAYGLSRGDIQAVLPEVVASVDAADPNRDRRVAWDVGLVDGQLPNDASAAWRAVAAAVDGDADLAAALLDQARAESRYDQTTHLAAAAVARFDCDEAAHDRAMRLAGRVLGGPVAALAIGRDPIYRDFGLGDYQPSWVERPPTPAVWPFGFLNAPTCDWSP